ncbi:putative methyltransferase KNAG_0M02200 [Huiozyma naganishii CBS 8797]|uniref:Sugar phosphate phosphatase n=1 Tax=Huiozyma naganishii (strain ATCC MYA-139 / BCRC 22969 / CBS 8797 / KCTC 17520 / NBRC 10181 / NCYC 3082 / Yp74L-3) TaxID=1071383 RepID=J7RT11_HUIN7|nr:hypothetical protein KNAG_0M02200 [Kazachstania naganishii CBS 8797]CCK73073.1 hypothetical protein KNAG_0M02200 [Kazachstania naganishii CBS 8797]
MAELQNGEPPRRFMLDDENTFGQFTGTERWPIIVQNAVDDVEAAVASAAGPLAREQAGVIHRQLLSLKQEIMAKGPLRPFSQEEVQKADIPGSLNEYLERDPKHAGFSWGHSEWLYTEIYLYWRIHVLFALQSEWSHFDVFNKLKQSTFKASQHGVVELAHRYANLKPQLMQLAAQGADRSTLQVLFKEFVEISLWGNATDLSLLTNATLEDIKSIQGAKARQASEAKILVNDTDRALDQLLQESSGDQQVDFVLDNSGFELYADLMLAAFLLHTGLASKCVFHAKAIPYMVSDVMVKDLDVLIADLRDRQFFPCDSQEDAAAMDLFAADIDAFRNSNALTIESHPFWTTDLDYWHIDPVQGQHGGAEVHSTLAQSALVIFKGDLNYRKLTGDRTWPRTTPWGVAIGPLAHNGVTLLSLRTCKADVQVGLEPGVDERLSQLWERDHPGKGSWWSSSGKWAVICYSSGE